MSAIYQKPGHITVSHNAAKNYILFDWQSFRVTIEEITTLHTQALDLAKQHSCYHYVAETSRVTNALRQDVVAWFGGTWMPTLAAYGLRAIVTVVPTSAIAMMSTSSWQRQTVSGIDMINVGSLVDAESTLAKL